MLRFPFRVASYLPLTLPLLLLLSGSVALADSTETLPAGLWGGDVRSLTIHPEDPDLLAAGTSAGHIYLSRDGGRSWSDAGERVPFAGWVVGTLRFDPHRPKRLWAGLWGVWGSGLVAMSDDLGATWRPRSGPNAGNALPAEPVYDLSPVPGQPDTVYAGTRSGVWLSRDAGITWSHLTASYPEVHHVSSLLVQPGEGNSGEPDRLIAGTWRRAYRSDDGGLTWFGVFEGMQLDSEVFQLRPVPGRFGELWASTCGWVYHSPNLGEKWTRYKQGLPERRTPSFAVLEDGRLLAGTIAGLYVSGDRGRSWQRRTDPELSIRAIAHDPRRPARIVLGTEGAGVWVSTDGGSTFAPSSPGMTNLRVEALLAVHGSNGGSKYREVLAAIRHAGPLSGIYRSSDGGRSFEPEATDLPPVLAFADAGDRIYAATEAGLFERSIAGEPSWRLVAELGKRRIEEALVQADTLIVETAEGRFARDPETLRFRPFYGVALSSEDRPYDSPGDALAGNGRTETAGERQVFWDRSEIWYRANRHHLWKRVAAGDTVRLVATGDSRRPVLLVRPEEARLFDAEAGSLEDPLRLYFPARDVKTAVVLDDRLLLGTTGHGLIELTIGLGDPAPGAGSEVSR